MTDRGPSDESWQSVPAVVAFAAGDAAVSLSRIIANTAVALSDIDLNVLVVDTRVDGDQVRDVLEPFLIETANPLDGLDAESARLVARFTDAPLTLFRHTSPVGRGALDVLGNFRDFPAITAYDLENARGGEIRALLRTTAYDVVLLGLLAETEAQARLVADLADKVAVCFVPRHTSIREAVRSAAMIYDAASRPLRFIAVATPFDAKVSPRANQTISEIRRSFSALGPDVAERVVRVPLQTAGSPLGLLLEDPATPHRRNGALEAYGDLAWFITGGRGSPLPPAPRPVRDRYRRASSARHDVGGEMRAVVAYTPMDRPWADWVGEQLRQAGFTVGWWPADQHWLDDAISCTLVVLGSARFAASTVSLAVTEALRRPDVADHDVVFVQVEPGHTDVFPTARPIDLTVSTEADAVRRLLAGLGLVRRAADAEGREPRHRFPRIPPVERASAFSVPRQTTALIGRHAYLEQIRTALVGAEAVGLVVAAGEPGVGKSAIAQEYAFRFKYDYDVVWWIPAGSPQDIRARLAQLGNLIGVEPSDDMVRATFGALRSMPPGRVLLIYDSADDAGALISLLPMDSNAHVIITATGPAAEALRQVPAPQIPLRHLPIEELSPREAVSVLRTYTPALPSAEAEGLLDEVGRLPLSLHLAGALIRHFAAEAEHRRGMSASEAASRATADLAARVTERSFAAILAVTRATLSKGDRLGRLALRLAELCCYLDPARVRLSLLSWPAMVEQLALAAGENAQTLLDEPDDVDQVMWLGQRLEIFSVFWGAKAELRMHYLVRAQLIDAMTDEQRVERRRQAARGLAGYAAGRLNDEVVMAELRPHLLPSGALESAEQPVRRWVVAQLHWVSVDDDAVAHARTLGLAHEALSNWRSGGEPDDSLTIWLATVSADLERRLGQPDRSLSMDETLVGAAAGRFGWRSVRTLTARRGMSGDLRGLGQFDRALVLDQGTWRQFREMWGDDHLQTLRAAHNLAISYFLAGYPERALHHEQDTLRRRLDLFGADEPFTWWSMAVTAGFQRELGRYAEASRQLYEALDRVRKSRPASHPDVLRIKGHLAVAERRLGRHAVARQLNSDVYNGYRHSFGSGHPRTRASLLSLTMDQFYLQEWEAALQLASQCMADYEHALPAGHPFAEVCRANVALVRWGAHRSGAARDEAARAARELAGRLGEIHPWVLAARLNLAGMSQQAADRPVRTLLRLCQEFLGRAHPYTQVAAAAATSGGRPAPIDIDVPEV